MPLHRHCGQRMAGSEEQNLGHMALYKLGMAGQHLVNLLLAGDAACDQKGGEDLRLFPVGTVHNLSPSPSFRGEKKNREQPSTCDLLDPNVFSYSNQEL